MAETYDVKVGLWGGPGGGSFTFRPNGKITSISGRSGVGLFAIRFGYLPHGTQDDEIIKSPWYGEESGRVDPEMYIEAGEEIVELSGTIGSLFDHTVITSLTFKTNKDKIAQFGTPNGKTSFSLPVNPDTTRFVGFNGRSGTMLDAIGAILAEKKDVEVGLWGGPGGGSFTFKPNGKIIRISARISSGIIAIRFGYGTRDNETKSPWYGGEGGSEKEMYIEEGEEIIELSGRVGNLFEHMVITSLTFKTNKDKSMQFGTPIGETNFSVPVNPNTTRVVGFYGRSGTLLDAIGAILVPM